MSTSKQLNDLVEEVGELEDRYDFMEQFLEELGYSENDIDEIKEGMGVESIKSDFEEKLIKKIEELDPKFNREIDLESNSYFM